MFLKLMYITNNESIAKIAESSGVDWIFIDLEINGKEERQNYLDTVISRHKAEDVSKIKSILTSSELLVRVNPIYEASLKEINQVIDNGADIIMLPFFTNKEEVETFLRFVNKRAKTCLLVETPEAVDKIDEILSLDGIDFIHIGLNDLHLGYKKKFMFELLADGTVENLCEKFIKRGITFGFGGIARIREGMLPAERIITEHYRLGSSMAILSRTFCNSNKTEDTDKIAELFQTGVQEIRMFERELSNKSVDYFKANRAIVVETINEIVKNMGENC